MEEAVGGGDMKHFMRKLREFFLVCFFLCVCVLLGFFCLFYFFLTMAKSKQMCAFQC